MDGRQKGVTVRGNKIYIEFSYRGKRCREATGLEATPANLKYAARKKAAIEHEISTNTFNYGMHFPNSKRANIGLKGAYKSVSRALDEFISAARKRCSASTLRGYNSIVEFHLKPKFGHLSLADLTTSDVRVWISTLNNTSNKRINNILTPLRGIMGDAFADGLIDRDPTQRIKNLRNEKNEPDPFTPVEREKILDVMDVQTRNLFEFAFWTGMRTSELIALQWSDIDFDRQVVRVRRAFVLKQFKETKTQAGQREIKLFPPALEALIRQKSFSYLTGKQVFHNPRTNKPWETDGQIRKTAWQPALRKAGVIYRNPYQTRHTYASTLLSAGENPMWVAQQMGHKDWGMIRKTYGRWIPEVDTSAGGKVMQYWEQICHKEVVSV